MPAPALVLTVVVFQSSLPVAGERVRAAHADQQPPGTVSILAPRRRGACPAHRAVPGQPLDVSILAPRRRGACPACGFLRPVQSARFNPRSPSPGSVSTLSCTRQLTGFSFQSSLPVAGERVPLARSSSAPASRWFQSSLPVAGERVPGTPFRLCPFAIKFQSSLPVAGERVRPDRTKRCTKPKFQSSLPVAGERVLWIGAVATCGNGCFNPRSPSPGSVSRRWPSHRARRRSFNPRSPSPGSVSRCPARAASIAACFNPRSPSPGSVSGWHRKGRCWTVGFNPRSPSPGSVSVVTTFFLRVHEVSILAPRRRGACPHNRLCPACYQAVSILAPRRRGACPRLRLCAAGQRPGFNPRSPSPGSVSFLTGVLKWKRSLVSILAPRRRGACPTTMQSNMAASARFQSSLPVAGERVRLHSCPGNPRRRCFNPRSPSPGSVSP